MAEIKLADNVTVSAGHSGNAGGIWVRTEDKYGPVHVFITASELKRFAIQHAPITYN